MKTEIAKYPAVFFVALEPLTSSMPHPCLISRILFLSKTNTTLAVTQGLRPLFRMPYRPLAGCGPFATASHCRTVAPSHKAGSDIRRKNGTKSCLCQKKVVYLQYNSKTIITC